MPDTAPIVKSVRDKVSDAEWEVRVDLAAFYRLVAHYGWDDLTATHISARVPGEDAFLLNPHGLFFDEITASSLVKVDYDNNVLLDGGYPINQAGFTIHSAVLSGRPDVTCAAHTHTRAGMAVSAMKDGLLPLAQTALRFHNRLSYHDYEGVALDHSERERLIGHLGKNKAMILRNHGLLTCGESVSETFNLLFYLEKSCQLQVDCLGSGRELHLPDEETCEFTAQQFDKFSPLGKRDWPGLLRKLDRIDPGFRA
ncbi:class II aldolase/adducin family protein [Minwuia thermotolerans]|uniref:Class II aldolase n=1 Tax=Minwuia thermotolerans TaxID=2056226 RepID=A0A2M9FZI7_9PROT|nr:class II aldolase/adducin family protein [Minwuia thermotolerans]PJK28878.1 class II aldolase [Minwuia thermotolerans]